jgi:excisionase family DNA binding protein
MALTAERLRSLGVAQSPELVEALLYRAIARAVDPRAPADPRHELTAAEVAVLESGGADLTPLPVDQDDPMLAAAVEYAALLATALSVEETAKLLGVHQTRVRQRLTARTLYAVRDGNVWRLPRFQFEGNRVVPGAERVFPALPADAHPVGVARWFTSRDPDLVVGHDETPVSPRDWLAGGRDPAEVARLAAEL